MYKKYNVYNKCKQVIKIIAYSARKNISHIYTGIFQAEEKLLMLFNTFFLLLFVSSSIAYYDRICKLIERTRAKRGLHIYSSKVLPADGYYVNYTFRLGNSVNDTLWNIKIQCVKCFHSLAISIHTIRMNYYDELLHYIHDVLTNYITLLKAGTTWLDLYAYVTFASSKLKSLCAHKGQTLYGLVHVNIYECILFLTFRFGRKILLTLHIPFGSFVQLCPTSLPRLYRGHFRWLFIVCFLGRIVKYLNITK